MRFLFPLHIYSKIVAFSKLGFDDEYAVSAGIGRAQYTVFRKMFLEHFGTLERVDVPVDQLYKTFNYGCFCRNIIKPVDEYLLPGIEIRFYFLFSLRKKFT